MQGKCDCCQCPDVEVKLFEGAILNPNDRKHRFYCGGCAFILTKMRDQYEQKSPNERVS